MGYCDGLCPYLDERKHKCARTGEKLAYIKGWWGTTHEHRGIADCENMNMNLTCIITELPCPCRKDIDEIGYCTKAEGECEYQMLGSGDNRT